MLTANLTSIDKRPLILIVDDVRSNQQLLAELLKDDFHLKVASSGQRALEIVKQHPDIALILLDVSMPEMDGYEVCKALKADNHTKAIPIIFVTAAGDEASESYGLQLGAVDYITKPIKPVITKLRIQNHIAIRQYQEKLRFSAEIIKNSKESIIVTDHNCHILDVNPAFIQCTGYSREEVIGKNPRILSSGHQNKKVYQAMWREITTKGFWCGELWNRKKSGEFYPEWITIIAILDQLNKVTNYVGIASDITLLKLRERELEQMASFDVLTGVPNRALLADRLKQAISQSKREHKLLGVCYLDLDGFKPVNDTFGHHAGDQVLIEIARRIGQTIRAGDTVARLGGDEFALLLLGLEQKNEYSASIERILDAIRKPIYINEAMCELGASIGVTLFPLDDAEPDTLLRHADHAMYIAKQSGKNCFHLYNPTDDCEIRVQHEYFKRIKVGLDQNEFELFYQPKIEMLTGKLVGVEALIRWHHPERGLLCPGEFLPLIESHDLIVQLGDWVINQALLQLHVWLEQDIEIPISINVAGRQLQHKDFINKLKAALALYSAVPSNLLELEILETSALEIEQSAQIIKDVRSALGVAFALDDFGTGYSSLTYLKALPAMTLKIDQTFVRDMLDDASDRAIVQAIIALANTFNRKTVAEGVETIQHFEVLLNLGCEIGQGYGIARPMPVEKFMLWRESRL